MTKVLFATFRKRKNNTLRLRNHDRHRNIVPSGLSVLPLGIAAEHSFYYFWDYFSLFSFLCHICFPRQGSPRSFKKVIWGLSKSVHDIFPGGILY